MNQEILLLASLISNNLCITLDAKTGVCLRNVASYQPGEVDIDDAKGKPTGEVELKPCLFFVGGEILILSDEQNKNFRLYWDALAAASNQFFGILASLSAPTATPA